MQHLAPLVASAPTEDIIGRIELPDRTTAMADGKELATTDTAGPAAMDPMDDTDMTVTAEDTTTTADIDPLHAETMVTMTDTVDGIAIMIGMADIDPLHVEAMVTMTDMADGIAITTGMADQAATDPQTATIHTCIDTTRMANRTATATGIGQHIIGDMGVATSGLLMNRRSAYAGRRDNFNSLSS